MAKRRSPQLNTPPSAVESAPGQETQSKTATEPQAAEGSTSQAPTIEAFSRSSSPAPRLRGLISLAIVVHGFCLLLAVFSNLDASYLQGRMLGLVGPYLHATHQYYRALPLELTRAESLDFPLQVELQVETTGSDSLREAATWQPLAIAGLLGSGRDAGAIVDARWHNLGRWLSLIASADPESEILSEFASRAVQLAERQSGKRYQAVRLVSAKVLSYDEDLAIEGSLSDPDDESFQPSVIYSASIVRFGNVDAERQRLSLIPAQDALRTAKPVDFDKELP